MGKLVEYIEEGMGIESPVMFGLHPNTEIGFRTDQSNTMYSIISDLQPKGASGGGGGGGGSSNDRVAGLIEELSEKLNDSNIDIEELIQKIEDEGGRTPFINVFYQESVYMNVLTHEILKSLEVLTLGLNGELQMSESMDALSDALYAGKVVGIWSKLAYPSMNPSEVEAHSREGSFTYGLTMEGARWDSGISSVAPSLPKEMFCPMPVMLMKAVT